MRDGVIIDGPGGTATISFPRLEQLRFGSKEYGCAHMVGRIRWALANRPIAVVSTGSPDA